MLRPVIFIGCGGSGGKAVRYVRDAALRSLEHNGWEHGLPSAWQFIVLDTVAVPDGGDGIPPIPARDFLTLTGMFGDYKALYRALVAQLDERQKGLLCGWLPDPEQVKIPLKSGAGQNRAIGRVTGLYSLEGALHDRLKEAFARAQSGGPELYEVGLKMGADAALGSEVPEPLVVVCTSMAGGTGAGVALDVVDFLRARFPQGRYPCLVLFANDIFDLASNQAMAANSLGFMSEMLAAYWSESGEIDTPLTFQGVQAPGVGPHSVFILGRSGFKGADLGGMAQVYQAVGEALSTWVTSSIVQERIQNFIHANWNAKAMLNLGGYPFGQEQLPGAASSFGAAKVTVGRDRFAQWAKDKLARAVLEGLVEGHLRLNTGDAAGSKKPESELVQELGEQYAETVYQAVPLVGAPPDPVPGCYGAPDYFAPQGEVRAIAKRMEREMAFPAAQPAPGPQWRDLLREKGRRLGEQVEKDAKAAQDGDWCQRMVDASCTATSQVAAISSLEVAAAALEHAANKLNPAEVNRNRRLASEANQRYDQRVREGLDLLASAPGSLTGNSPTLRDAVELIAQGVASRWQALRLEAAANVMEQAGDQVLRVMATSLKAALQQADIALKRDDEVKAWPRHDDGVSQGYLPSSVELPLESHEVWEAMFDDLCQEAAIKNVPYGDRSTDKVRYRVVAGAPLVAGGDDINALVFREQQSLWTPGFAANLNCKAGKDDIEGRVHQWTHAAGSKFARVIDEGLASYLGEENPNHASRMETFRVKLGEAKRKSEPFVSLDFDLYGEFHDRGIELVAVCSPFPFGEGHPASTVAREIMGEGVYESVSHDTSSVLISQYIDYPLHPMAMRSFTDPIMDSLAATKDPGKRSVSFWMWRRSRRLDGFVPMPRPVLESIIRGFAVARLCGYITADIDRPVRITAGPDTVEFPWPLLSQLTYGNDILAGLLEGFSLTFGMVSSEGVSAYEGYRRLYELGEPSGHGRLHGDLEAVLETGNPPYARVGGEEPKVLGITPEDRQKYAQQYLEANIDMFKEQEERRGTGLFHKSTDGRAESGVPTMELAELFSKCYTEVLESLRTQEHGRGVV